MNVHLQVSRYQDIPLQAVCAARFGKGKNEPGTPCGSECNKTPEGLLKPWQEFWWAALLPLESQFAALGPPSSFFCFSDKHILSPLPMLATSLHKNQC